MDQQTLVALVVVVAVVVIAALIVIAYRRRRSQHLKQQFGAEYDRAVLERGDPAKAEVELINREKRVQSFSIKELNPTMREQFRQDWIQVQNRFVDDPAIAVSEADSLVNRVMATRGYPMSDFEQRAADISVTYPAIGQAGTEDLRQAMVHYRSLFDELLGVPNSAAAPKGVPYERAS